MPMGEGSGFRLSRPGAPLPDQSDFGAHRHAPDALTAWRNFGELSLPQAYDLFCKCPENYQEDFMFMGGAAFGYYFPVIDRYLRTVTGVEEGDDCQAAILGSGVALQFEWIDARLSPSVVAEISDLAQFVRANLGRYSPAAKDRRRVDREWSNVEQKVLEYRAGLRGEVRRGSTSGADRDRS